MNPLKELDRRGQSIWLDYIRRGLLTSGELARLIREDGVRGVTSNPSIFEKAIAGSDEYDESLRSVLERDPGASAEDLFEALAVEDIRLAADALRPVYEGTDGFDGYVSLEVSPHLARDTRATIREAQRLWEIVDRPNLMIKVPATEEGVPALEALIALGINVNATLMFSLAHYEAVAWSYIRGLEETPDPSRVASVASFFVSRVDTAVDRALQERGTREALSLRGRAAVANARSVYRRFLAIFHGEAFGTLRGQGAKVQRPLWASTSTKNPAYSDVLYVDELVGAETINTLRPVTLEAFRDHGTVRDALGEDSAEADTVLARLELVGIDLASITDRLQIEGVQAFADSYDQLLLALEEKRSALWGQSGGAEFTLHLGTAQGKVDRRLREWEKQDFVRRLWSRDTNLWSSVPVPELADRLGWLDLPSTMRERVEEMRTLAADVRQEGIRDVVLLGMGGSSLAPEVFQATLGSAPGFPALTVLDSTHPDAVREVDARTDPATTLFVVSSKSGTTVETLSFFRHFWKGVSEIREDPGRHFVTITDPGTPLETLARERGFRAVFLAPKDVGGRFSALTPFGLVPASLIGVDASKLLERASAASVRCGPSVPASGNIAVSLGAALGELARLGRDKVTFFTPGSLRAFPAWLEQLVAESLGKEERGILPVADEPGGDPKAYGSDRVFVAFRVGGPNADYGVSSGWLADMRAEGHPVIHISMADPYDLGAEMFRWEMAVAAAGAILGVHPFNQPDVELAKQLARQAMARSAGEASPPVRTVRADDSSEAAEALLAFLAQAREGDYVALQAYLAPVVQMETSLRSIQVGLRDHLGVATTLGFGPRYLHSTGQFHKGGPNTGLFVQFVDRIAADLEVAETDYTFGVLVSAQAEGDLVALLGRGRRVLRVDLGSDAAGALRRLEADIR